MKVNIIIGFRTLKVKCIQNGICSQATFKNARAMFFFEVGRGRQQFSFGIKNVMGGFSPPKSDTPKIRRGVFAISQ